MLLKNQFFSTYLILLALFAVHVIRCSDDDDDDDDVDDEAPEGPSDVLVLTTANFDETVTAATDGILVEFYAPWCGHCKQLAPEYDAAAAELKRLGLKTPLAKVDATVETELAQKFGVQGYPTLKWFAGGDASNASEYDGGRTKDTIIEWIKKTTGPAVEILDAKSASDDKKIIIPKTVEDVNSIKETVSYPAVILSGVSQNSVEFATFNAVAKSQRKIANFYLFENVSGASEATVTIAHLSEDPISLDKAVVNDGDELKQKVIDNSFPLFGELNGDTFQKYVDRAGSPGLVWCLFPMQDGEKIAEVAENYRQAISEVAKEYVGKYSFTFTDTVAFKDALNNMLGVSTFPQIVVNKKPQDKKKFVLDLTESKKVEADQLKKFMSDIEEGKIEPEFKSEDIPTYTGEEPVRDVVGKNLETEVFLPETDVLFEVYAPWCGHCKKLAPEYEKVGKKAIKEKVDHLILLKKMDGTKNDSPREDIDWSGFPSLFYIKAGTNVVEKFEGPRDAKGIWKWIKKNHSKADELNKILDANKKAKEDEKAAAAADTAEKTSETDGKKDEL